MSVVKLRRLKLTAPLGINENLKHTILCTNLVISFLSFRVGIAAKLVSESACEPAKDSTEGSSIQGLSG